MDAPTWVYASIAAVTVFHLCVLVYLRARRRGWTAHVSGRTDAGDAVDPGDATGDAGDAARDADGGGDGDTVRCGECGVENRRRFRFCRNCVAELPGSSLSGGAGGAASPGAL